MSDAFTVTFAPAGTLQAFDTPNCDAWVIEGAISFDHFIAIYDEKAAAHAGHHILSSFDDYGQACYTSGHAMQKNDLDPPYVEGGTELSSTEKFAAIYAKFMAKTGSVTFADLAGRLSCSDNHDHISVADLNSDPDQCLDARIVMQIVPVTVPEDSLAAFPNGYFVDDLQLFENYVLAKHMRLHHACKLIAIGASHLCFLRSEPFDVDSAIAAAIEITTLYQTSDPANYSSELALSMLGTRYLILTYADL
jgi:hypothetical protein